MAPRRGRSASNGVTSSNEQSKHHNLSAQGYATTSSRTSSRSRVSNSHYQNDAFLTGEQATSRSIHGTMSHMDARTSLSNVTNVVYSSRNTSSRSRVANSFYQNDSFLTGEKATVTRIQGRGI